ncbi:MAG: hypothetical protein GX861_03585 [Tenericutes bacterium]|jgi:thiol-disulfide isomerase/thioredoxin|nr:hypothetical protein [Mycoplasmatota bacterium]
MKKYGLLLIALIIFVAGCEIKTVDEVKENTFALEYHLDFNHPYKYITPEEAIDFLQEGSGIIMFGFSSCPWCQSMVNILYEVAKDKNINEIYYLDIKKIREQNTEEYQQIVNILNDYLYEDKDNNKRIYVPDIYFLNEGKILGHDNDLSILSGNVEEYITKEKEKEIKEKLLNLIAKTFSGECIDCED